MVELLLKAHQGVQILLTLDQQDEGEYDLVKEKKRKHIPRDRVAANEHLL